MFSPKSLAMGSVACQF